MTSEMDRTANAEEEPRGGTGLADVFKILTKVPYERQLSLTYKLGVSLAEELVHAMSLISLGKRSEALDKLQALGDNNLIAYHLAEKVRICGVKLEDLTVSIVPFQESNVGTLVDLARIFKVLTEERLCDTSLRDLAYQTALTACKNKISVKKSSQSEYLYMELREEAKSVCGPQIVDTVAGTSSPEDSSSGLCSIHQPHKGSTVFPDQNGSGQSLPASLREDYSIYSYPSHLEISVSGTVDVEPSNPHPQPTPRMGFNPMQSPVPICGINAVGQGTFKYFSRVTSIDTPHTHNEPQTVKGEMDRDRDTRFSASGEHQTYSKELRVSGCSPTPSTTPAHTKLDNPPNPKAHDKACPTNKLVPRSNISMLASRRTSLADGTALNVPLTSVSASVPTPPQDEETDTFFSFVILHAQEDVAMADRLKERLEGIGVGDGATFFHEFALPGRNTLTCVEDAINNSAFIFLLLTCNFNSRMLEVETSSALLNAIDKKHKCNTVIPFLPNENRMPRENIPIVLRIYNALEEDRTFENKVKKVMAPARIAKIKQVWLSEQAIRAQVRRRERLRQEELHIQRQQSEKLDYEIQQQQQQAMRHYAAEGLECQPLNPTHLKQQNSWQIPQGNIRIENARYIIIGDNSKMAVGVDVVTSEDEDDQF